MKRKVLIPTKLDKIAAELLKADGHYEVVQDASAKLPELAAKHPDTCALIVRSEEVTAAVIDAMPSLKVVIRAGAGYNTIDIKYARKKGVDVMNTPGANANGVAEEVVAMMLADARHLIAADASCRRGEWEKTKFMGREVAGKTVGIVGLGNIGRLVAKRLSGFECRLLGYDPVISSERAGELGVELADIETIFRQSDYVSLHVPETKETRGMVGEALLALMKPGATIINCARAGIVNEEAVRKVKAARNIRLLNDVYPKDEPGPKSVADIADIMLPHLGASTHEANWTAAKRSAEQLIDFDSKGVTSYIVNRDIPDGLDRAYCELANALARLARSVSGVGTPVKLIETSFYGSLKPFADWLVVPVVAGIAEEFDRSMDGKAARQFLKDKGIEYVNRDPDEGKRYGGSITVDLTFEMAGDMLKQVSVRGTIAEGVAMVSRINEFDHLYFEPAGDAVFFLYDDRPGVIGAIGVRLAAAGVNIADMRNPNDPKTNRSLAIMKVSQPVPESVVRDIAREIKAQAAFSVQF
jgi:D-3-phosphoglycerate dehydrogenase